VCCIFIIIIIIFLFLSLLYRPCILIFDSLAKVDGTEIFATIRDYLHEEYKVKHQGQLRDFTEFSVKESYPIVPQQTNCTDCGLFVLQYAESFFKVN